MKIQETQEYRLVKQLTAKENKVRLIKAAFAVTTFMVVAYGGMIATMDLLLYLWKD